MNENIKKRYELLATKVLKGLESRNMTGYYAATKEEALAKALEIIPKGASITMGGAMSAHEIGLVKALMEGDYNFIDRDKATTPEETLPACMEYFKDKNMQMFIRLKLRIGGGDCALVLISKKTRLLCNILEKSIP